MTHGATNKNSIKYSSSSSSSKEQNNNNNNNNSNNSKRERNKERVASTERPELRISSPPSGLNFGDVLFRSRSSSSKSSSQETTGYGSRKSDDTDSQREGKKLTPINSSKIELDLIDNYPGVPKVIIPSSHWSILLIFSSHWSKLLISTLFSFNTLGAG